LITLAEIETNQGETNMKKQNLFIMTALVIGLTACGGNDDQPVANPNPYTPGSYYPIPSNPSSGSFQNTEQWMVAQLQAIYGNVTTSGHAILGSTTLPVGTHSWQTILDRVKTAAQSCGNYCQIQSYGYNYSYLSPLARTDFNRLRSYLNFAALSNVGVRYANDPGYQGYSLAHSMDQVLNILSQSYGQMFNNWYGYGYYPVSYTPWYSGSGMIAGLNYGSSGLQISVGGSFNW
jgi:hypothetical protein